jgi:WD40 repeat protein
MRLYSAGYGYQLNTPAAFDGDGKLILTASPDRTARIWDKSTGEVQHLLNGCNAYVEMAVFQPSSRLALIVRKDGNITLWDVNEGTRIASVRSWQRPGSPQRCVPELSERLFRTPTSPFAPVTAAAISPDGRRVAVGFEDGAVRLVHLPTTQELIDRGHALLASFSEEK